MKFEDVKFEEARVIDGYLGLLFETSEPERKAEIINYLDDEIIGQKITIKKIMKLLSLIVEE